MDINQMTHSIQNALQKAIEYAKEYHLTNVEIEAVLKAVLEQPESLYQSILERANIDTEALDKAYTDKLSRYATVKGDNVQYGQYLGTKTNELFNKAEQFMGEYEDSYISMEHVLRAAMEIDETTQQAVNHKKEVIIEIIKKCEEGIM